MTQTVKITDTGKRRTTSASAEETDIANSGTAISLHGAEVTLMDSAILNTNPPLGKYATSSDSGTRWASGEVDTIGIEKPKWTVRGHLDDTSNTDMALVKPLRWLAKTKGYKTLLCDLGDWSDGSNNASTVNVHVMSVKMVHRSNSNIIDYDIEAYETD